MQPNVSNQFNDVCTATDWATNDLVWGNGSKVQIGIEGLQEDNEGMTLNGVKRS